MQGADPTEPSSRTLSCCGNVVDGTAGNRVNRRRTRTTILFVFVETAVKNCSTATTGLASMPARPITRRRGASSCGVGHGRIAWKNDARSCSRDDHHGDYAVRKQPTPGPIRINDTFVSRITTWTGPLLVAVSSLLMRAAGWRRWADVFVDFGWQLCTPWWLGAGDVLYTDIAYFAGPLSPYAAARQLGRPCSLRR